MPLLTVDAMAPEDLAERIVLLRIDGNDKFGLRDTLPTLSYGSEAKARAVIATHCGTPTRTSTNWARGRTGWVGAVLGSVSRKVLDHAGCPVLVVRGPSQRSPASA